MKDRVFCVYYKVGSKNFRQYVKAVDMIKALEVFKVNLDEKEKDYVVFDVRLFRFIDNIV